MTDTKTVAGRVFDAQIEWGLAEEAAGDAILAAMGCDPQDTKTWPEYHDFGFDYYDGSFEMYGIADTTLVLTPEQQRAIAALGFSHGWFNYVDGTARHFYQKDGAYTHGLSHHHGPTEADGAARERKRLLAEIRRLQATATTP